MKNSRLPLAQSALLIAALLLVPPGFGQANAMRGLWVGTVSLRAVNEVAVPLNEANVPIAPNPQVPTPTFDEANLRLIIHVNGAGQAFLLKDVAILNRAAGTNSLDAEIFASESDLALVTDPRVYADFPPQPARRLASAAFDFGDALATEALDALVNEAASVAATYAAGLGSLPTQGSRAQAAQQGAALIVPAVQPIADSADVAEAFLQFVTAFNTAALDAIAADTGAVEVATFRALGETLRDQSFYADTRGVDMVDAVVAAVGAAAPADRNTAAYNTASSFADVENQYQRFLSGKVFGDMIHAAAEAAVAEAAVPGATANSITDELKLLPASVAAANEALLTKFPLYEDSRGILAVQTVLAAMGQAAFDNALLSPAALQSAVEAAGRLSHSDMVARYPLPLRTPGLDYTALVKSDAYSDAVQKVADAAAAAAVEERATNPLFTTVSLTGEAKVAAVNALRSEYALAARAQLSELPLTGLFAPGSGDPRPVGSLAQASDLGPAGLEGRIVLPASHPTNPFRHRRHREHSIGFPIERQIRLDFDGMLGDATRPSGYGVDQVTGTYREEIFGLHKPLGPEPETHPIGLKTEGRFELTRISLIDTLNTR